VRIVSYYDVSFFTFSLLFSQEVFMENYITSQRDHMFRNVEVMIYVFDVESRDLEKDLHYYQSCVSVFFCLMSCSPKQNYYIRFADRFDNCKLKRCKSLLLDSQDGSDTRGNARRGEISFIKFLINNPFIY
jgi:hypothetical protein